MSNHVTPTIGRIVWYRGKDNQVRAAIVAAVHGVFCLNLFVFGLSANDMDCGYKTEVTHGDINDEPGCYPSWSWMPYQKGQAAKTEQLEQKQVGATEIKSDNNGLLPHQQRVVNERDELVGRMAKLYGFINGGGPAFNQLDNAEQYRLRRQLGHMTSYAEVLDERIAAFQSAPVPTFADNSLPGASSEDLNPHNTINS